VLAEAAPPGAPAKTAIIAYGKRVGTTLNVCTDMGRQVWDFSRRAPVIITEWISGVYFSDADTPESTVQFLQYLQEHGIGLDVGVWEWTSGGFGSARRDLPSPKVSCFTGLSCHQKGYGLGKVVDSW
jgi:hypothetical protein